jgi:lysophospholipase L1-like esterase
VSVRLRITCTVALCAMLSSTAMVLGAGIAAACSGVGGGGCEPPTASTGSASSITSNSATLSGSVNARGCTTYYVFEWGTSSSGPFPDSIEGSAGKETFPKAVSTNLPPGILQPSTQYYFRLSAINSEGKKATGSAVPFKTSPACPKPTVTAEFASSITHNSATLNGKVTPNGCATLYTYEYGPIGGTHTKITDSAGSTGTISVPKAVSNLQAETMYDFRLSAKNNGGTTDGLLLYFTTKPPPPVKYLAMGDSYSAGTGTGAFYEPGGDSCHRTTLAYPYLLHNAHPFWGYSSVACHGAKAREMIDFQAQSLTQDTTLVTYTIGGNDAKFSEVIDACRFIETTNCFQKIAEAQTIINTQLPKLLEEANNKIKAEAKNAKVIVLDYPRIFNGENCSITTHYSTEEMNKLNETAEKLRTVLSAATAKAGSNFLFLDVMNVFNTHAVCDPPGSGEAAAWINGVELPTYESFHPKAVGHKEGYFKLVKAITG